MAIHPNLNQTGNGGNHFHYYLKEILKAAGWKVLDSGCGEDSLGNSTPHRQIATAVSVTIAQQTPDATHMQLAHTGAFFTAAMVGQYIDITGMAVNNNVSDARISAYIDTDNIQIENATGGVSETVGATSYQIHGDHFTSAVIGANDLFAGGTLNLPFDCPMGAAACWYRAQDPAGNRELLALKFDQDSSTFDAYWWMGYSKAAKFTGGSPTFKVAPTATDEQTVSSAGTRGTPSGLHGGSGTANLYHFAADDAPSAAGEYGFLAMEFTNPNDLKSCAFLDDLANTAVGDTHPLVLGHNNQDMLFTSMYNDSGRFGVTFADNGGGGEIWKGVEYNYYTGQAGTYHAVGGKTSKYDGKERPMLVPVCEPTVGGYLGISRWFHCTAVQRDYPNTGDSFNVLYVDDVVLVDIWDGATTPQSI